jgi:hypothetical protein
MANSKANNIATLKAPSGSSNIGYTATLGTIGTVESALRVLEAGGLTQVYPAVGLAVSTGAAWNPSIALPGGTTSFLRADGTFAVPPVAAMIASGVTFTPTGSIVATDVQAAIAEINTDLGLNTGAGLVGHLTNLGASTNVQTALQGLETTSKPIRLQAATTYYVANAGTDSNNAGLVGTPWRTIQYAWDWIVANVDLAGYTMTIRLVDAAYATPTNVGLVAVNPIIGGVVIIEGGGATTFTVTSGAGCLVARKGVAFSVQNLTLTGTVGQALIFCDGAKVTCLAGIVLGTSSSAHLRSTNNGYLYMSLAYSVTGGSTTHWSVTGSSNLQVGAVLITVSGGLSITYWANVGSCSYLATNGATFSTLVVTGQKYLVFANAVVDSIANTYPGGTAGLATTGGIYA